jgi:hypothetical protein
MINYFDKLLKDQKKRRDKEIRPNKQPKKLKKKNDAYYGIPWKIWKKIKKEEKLAKQCNISNKKLWNS